MGFQLLYVFSISKHYISYFSSIECDNIKKKTYLCK